MAHIPTHEFTVEILRSTKEIEQITPEWQDFIATQIREKNIHQDPYVIQSKLATVEGVTVYKPLIITLRNNHQIIAIAPFYSNKSKFDLKLGIVNLFSLPINKLQLFGDSVLIHKDYQPAECLDKIFDTLRAFNNDFDIISINSTHVPGTLWDYFESEQCCKQNIKLVPASKKMEVNRQIKMADSLDDYLGAMKKKTRYNLKRTAKKLSELDDGTIKTIEVRQPDDVKRFLQDLDTIYNCTWQSGTFGKKIRNTAAGIAFFENIAAKGWLRSYILKSDKTPIAFILGYQYNGIYYYDEIGHDLSWRKENPGNALNLHMMEFLHASDTPDIVDFGYGENDYKRIFGNLEFDARKIYLIKTSPNYGACLLRAHQLLDSIYLTLHTMAVKYKLDDYLRKLTKKRA